MDLETYALLKNKINNISANSISYDNSQSVGLISTDVQSAIDELSTRGGLKNEIVQVLPQIGEEGICYFVPNNSSEIENIYDEYIWFDSLNDYEKIGSTKVDISDLLKSEAITEPYDDTKTYDVGDYVTYLGYLYKCKTAVTTAQSFAPAKWDKIDIFTYMKNDGADYIANEKTYNALSTNDKTLTGAINEITGIVGSDNAPYVFRQTPFIASQENLKSIVGGSVVWNQLVDTSASAYALNSVSFSFTGGEFTITSTTNSTTPKMAKINAITNHVYFCRGKIKISNAENYARFGFYNSTSQATIKHFETQSTSYEYFQFVAKPTVDSYFGFRFPNATASGIYMNGKEVDCIDLTAMFGSTIADYVLSLETATAGSGIAWLQKYGFFTKQYYAYSANTMQSVNVSAHNTVGFNQWDEEWEVGSLNTTTGANATSSTTIRSKNYISVVPNTTYYFRMVVNRVNTWALFYDENKNAITGYSTGRSTYENACRIDSTTFTTPPNCAYMRFYNTNAYGTTYNNDICINLHWDGSRDGEYEAYEEHIYPLDSDLELRGIPKLDANNQLYYDGDTYESDGTVTRRYGIVDLSSKTWADRYMGDVNKAISTQGIANYRFATNVSVICEDYAYKGVIGSASELSNPDSKDIGVYFYYSSGSASRVVYIVLPKNSTPQGNVCYELDTPTTETADTFQNLQIVDDFGTEEFVDAEESAGHRDVAIPVGHNTDYFNSSILAYNIDYTNDKCEDLKNYIDEQIQQSITNVLNTSY